MKVAPGRKIAGDDEEQMNMDWRLPLMDQMGKPVFSMWHLHSKKKGRLG